jgi:riboflavin kinase/FMN adenylyltransferase
MKVYWLDQMDSSVVSGTVVCLGMFDGVHLGHQALILEGERVAREKNLALCVHTYDILPINFIHQADKAKELTTLEEKLQLFEQLGVEITAIDRFNDQLLRMSGRAFFQQVVADKLNARHVVAGFNHRFGYKSDSGREELEALCREHDMGLSIIPPVVTASGDLVSSTAIRQAILEDDLPSAAKMLGRPVEQAMIEQVKGTN